jgi:hypothetical protein
MQFIFSKAAHLFPTVKIAIKPCQYPSMFFILKKEALLG